MTATKKISKKELLADVKKMNSFGPRLTGSEAQLNYIDYLKKQIRDMGLEVYSDPLFLKRWEAQEANLSIFGFNGPEEIEISSVFPYSGETRDTGITAELCYVEDKIMSMSGIKDKIAVIEISELNSMPSELAFDKRTSYPPDIVLPSHYSGPVATTFVKFQYARLAKLKGARAVIFIWKGIHKDVIKGQYLPFILDYQGIPAVWVNEDEGKKLIEAAEGHRTAALKLTAKKDPHAYTESFCCMLPGTDRKEAVIVNTHTDGTNCIEENGPAALIQLIKALKGTELKRTHIFVFATGHFRLPSFRDIQGGGIQATSKWLAMHKDLWDGKRGHLKAVAGVSIEHLGCMEWKVENGEYKPTGEPQAELVYTGNSTLNDIYIDAAKQRKRIKTMSLRGHNFLHFGEGQPLFNVGIPEISTVSAPDCLCVISDGCEMDKFDIDLMHEQTEMFLSLIKQIDSLSSSEIGKCDDYSLVRSKSVSGKGDVSIDTLRKKILSAVRHKAKSGPQSEAEPAEGSEQPE